MFDMISIDFDLLYKTNFPLMAFETDDLKSNSNHYLFIYLLTYLLIDLLISTDSEVCW